MEKRRFTVLVVDDSKPLRDLVMNELRRHGIEPIGAGDGDSGLKAFQANLEQIDLAILDMMMPVMNGLDLAVELERRRPGIKILFISGQIHSIAMDSIQRQSADRVLLKPFKPGELVERVTRLLAADTRRRSEAAPIHGERS